MSVVSMHYVVPGDDFTRAGEASGNVKRALKQLGIPSDIIRRVAIAMYEGEINILLSDSGPGIADVEKAMQEGYSTAPDRVRALGFGAGMGLPNIKKYTDSMRIETELGRGTKVYMTVYLHPQSEGLPS